MMRNVKQDLADYSQQTVNDIRMSRLVKFAGAAEEHRKLEATYGNEVHLNIPNVERVRNLVAQMLEEEADEVNGELPVISVFDAQQQVKSDKDLKQDAGLRALFGHLQRMWDNSLEGRGPSDITAHSFMQMKAHYSRNYPKSKAAKVIENFGKRGYATLDRRDLIAIAAEIETQDDFEKVVIENGLQGRAPNQVKARKFILACVNGQEDRRPFDRKAQDQNRLEGLNFVRVGEGGDTDLTLDDSPVYVGVVGYQWSNNSNSAAIYFTQDWGSEDASLQEAYAELEDWDDQRQSDEEREERWKTQEEEGYDPMTETYDGFSFTTTAAELQQMIGGLTGIYKDAFNEVTFEPPEVEEDEDFEKESKRPFDRKAQRKISQSDIKSPEYWISQCDEDEALQSAEEAVGNWKDFESFAWSDPPDPESWTLVYTSSGQSGILDQANNQIIDAVMGQFPEDQVDAQSHRHWAVGHIDGYSIRVYEPDGSLTPAFKAWCGLQQAMDRYPILDEELFSEMEYEATVENIKYEGGAYVNDATAPEGWPYEVYGWLSDNDQSELEATGDSGGYPSEEAIKMALSALGWLEEDEDFDKESRRNCRPFD